MKKRYCKNCRWYQGKDMAFAYFPSIADVQGCEIIIDCVKLSISGFANSEELNKNNDCDWYNKKHWWHRH